MLKFGAIRGCIDEDMIVVEGIATYLVVEEFSDMSGDKKEKKTAEDDRNRDQ